MNESTNFNIQYIVGNVDNLITSKVYSKNSPHYGKRIWIIQSGINKINILEDYLEDKDILKELELGNLLGKKYKFTVIKRGSYLINITEAK